jgi:hypothetical protein
LVDVLDLAGDFLAAVRPLLRAAGFADGFLEAFLEGSFGVFRRSTMANSS